MATVQISSVELLALKKLALINAALAKSLTDPVAKREQLSLTGILVEVVGRADVAKAEGRS